LEQPQAQVPQVEHSILGAVLAGGQSRRLGHDKALLEHRGEPLVVRAARVLGEVFSRVVVVSPTRESYLRLGLELVEDIVPDAGPLGGIYAALVHADGRNVFILACDHPFVEAPLVRYVTTLHTKPGEEDDRSRAAGARVAQWKERLYPLCGLYTAACRKPIGERLSRGELRVHDFLRSIETRAVAITEELPFYHPGALVNLNRPEDLSLLESLRSPGAAVDRDR
jgi:molybdopterin-guanine dinucleotide biosynthesis protein A